MKPQRLADNFLLHITVFLLGFTGILGKLITVSSDVLVWYRMGIAAVSMGVLILLQRLRLRLPIRDILIMMGIGVVVAIHWITFFGSIKLANVSITLICLSVTTLFVALLEPLFFRTKISWLEVALGLVIIASLSLVLSGQSEAGTKVHKNYTMGVIVGIISAILSGIFTILNKKVSTRYNGITLTFYEMLGGFLVISIYFVVTGNTEITNPLSWQDWLWLLILGIICTGFAFWAMLRVLQKISAYAVVLAINMEPVYGFVLAAILFQENEVLGWGFYLGSLVIIASIFLYSWMKRSKPENIGADS